MEEKSTEDTCKKTLPTLLKEETEGDDEYSEVTTDGIYRPKDKSFVNVGADKRLECEDRRPWYRQCKFKLCATSKHSYKCNCHLVKRFITPLIDKETETEEKGNTRSKYWVCQCMLHPSLLNFKFSVHSQIFIKQIVIY